MFDARRRQFTLLHLDGTTPKDERDAMLARLASGEVRVGINTWKGARYG